MKKAFGRSHRQQCLRYGESDWRQGYGRPVHEQQDYQYVIKSAPRKKKNENVNSHDFSTSTQFPL